MTFFRRLLDYFWLRPKPVEDKLLTLDTEILITMNDTMKQLKEAIAQNRDALASAQALIHGFADRAEQAKGDEAQMTELIAQLRGDAQGLAQAVLQNTPADTSNASSTSGQAQGTSQGQQQQNQGQSNQPQGGDSQTAQNAQGVSPRDASGSQQGGPGATPGTDTMPATSPGQSTGANNQPADNENKPKGGDTQ